MPVCTRGFWFLPMPTHMGLFKGKIAESLTSNLQTFQFPSEPFKVFLLIWGWQMVFSHPLAPQTSKETLMDRSGSEFTLQVSWVSSNAKKNHVPDQLARSSPQGWTAVAAKREQKGLKGSSNAVKLTLCQQPLPSLLFTSVDLASVDREMSKMCKVRDSWISQELKPAGFSRL